MSSGQQWPMLVIAQNATSGVCLIGNVRFRRRRERLETAAVRQSACTRAVAQGMENGSSRRRHERFGVSNRFAHVGDEPFFGRTATAVLRIEPGAALSQIIPPSSGSFRGQRRPVRVT